MLASGHWEILNMTFRMWGERDNHYTTETTIQKEEVVENIRNAHKFTSHNVPKWVPQKEP